MTSDGATSRDLPRFDRRFFGGAETLTAIGSGALGGKATGLLAAHQALAGRTDALRFSELEIVVPTMTVIATDIFDLFLSRNRLRDLVYAGGDDRRLALELQRAELPTELLGDLWDLVRQVHSPLAVRSSSLLEDALAHPFAGVYATKMIPNNQHDPETRFRKLTEAVKFVFASTFFREARGYVRAAGHGIEEEKMAVIVQEVVGRRHGPRYYPDVAGVARSFNYYPAGPARPAEGVVDLALGLGKTIVEGGRTWTYSPAHPRSGPPFNSVEHMLEQTQTEFWAVNMGAPPAYDPVAETEYLVRGDLADAEAEGTLRHIASTYDSGSDRVAPGLRSAGPRVLNFAPLLQFGEWPLNEAVRGLLRLFEERLGSAVEIEFALTFPDERDRPARLGFLQVRPMATSGETVEVGEERLRDPRAVVASTRVMGNGVTEHIRDVVFVKPESFDIRHSRTIAGEVERLNAALTAQARPYLLMGFGRWGSADPWLGIPVTWAQISGARAIVESSLPAGAADMSQGAHFFHNLLSFRVAYFSVTEGEGATIDWPWLRSLPVRSETPFVRHAEAPDPLRVEVDGRCGRGVVLRGNGGPP